MADFLITAIIFSLILYLLLFLSLLIAVKLFPPRTWYFHLIQSTSCKIESCCLAFHMKPLVTSTTHKHCGNIELHVFCIILQYRELIVTNRSSPAKCLTVMWILGQCGSFNFRSGLKGELCTHSNNFFRILHGIQQFKFNLRSLALRGFWFWTCLIFPGYNKMLYIEAQGNCEFIKLPIFSLGIPTFKMTQAVLIAVFHFIL